MIYRIRKAKSSDSRQILNLITELAVFEKEPESVELSAADLKASGFGEFPDFECFVAEKGDKIVGIAIIYMRFSTWKGRTLHLEDLIVSESLRGQGVGTALLNKVIIYGSKIGVKRISWEVLNWNTDAINFYKSKGASVKSDWNVVHLDEKGIKNYLLKFK